jgi:hypothetical protein
LRDREKMRERADLERQRDVETREEREKAKGKGEKREKAKGKGEKRGKRRRDERRAGEKRGQGKGRGKRKKKKRERKRSNLAPEINNKKKDRWMNSITLQVASYCSPMQPQSILACRWVI